MVSSQNFFLSYRQKTIKSFYRKRTAKCQCFVLVTVLEVGNAIFFLNFFPFFSIILLPFPKQNLYFLSGVIKQTREVNLKRNTQRNCEVHYFFISESVQLTSGVE